MVMKPIVQLGLDKIIPRSWNARFCPDQAIFWLLIWIKQFEPNQAHDKISKIIIR